jgi:hypothetical protein
LKHFAAAFHPEESMAERNESLRCKECGEAFTSRDRLDRHNKDQHTSLGSSSEQGGARSASGGTIGRSNGRGRSDSSLNEE